MHVWELPAVTPIDLVFEWCANERRVDRLLLSARLDQKQKEPVLARPSVEEVVAAVFGERVLEKKLARRWPGSELVGHNGVVYEIDFDPSLIGPMAEVGQRLSDWQHNSKPPLPEDPCLFRLGDDWPVLVSVTHEGDAWIISENCPPFCDPEPYEFNPENLMVPTAAEGFVGE